MTVRITLDSNIGTDLGPFNLTADIGTVTPSTATRAQLISGLDVVVDIEATELTVTSTGNCTNTLQMTITGIPPAIAAIVLLAGGTGCSSGNPGDFASNTIWVSADWEGFVLNANNHLVVNNGITFAAISTTYYDPSNINFRVSPNSIPGPPTSFVNPSAPDTTFLVQNVSLNNITGPGVEVQTDSSDILATFAGCN